MQIETDATPIVPPTELPRGSTSERDPPLVLPGLELPPRISPLLGDLP